MKNIGCNLFTYKGSYWKTGCDSGRWMELAQHRV